MTSMRVYTENHLTPETWRERAACLEVTGDIFFPEKYDTRTAAHARSICATCDVTVECLNTALERNEQHGIYAGLTVIQRRRILKGRNI